MNYYKRHLGDYARDTGHLTALEHGIYCLLLDYYYSTEKPIPKDRAHRIARANPEQTQMVCEEFFISDGDTWRHPRVDREIAEYNAKADKNRENGTKGGRPASQQKPNKNPFGYYSQTQKEPTGNLSHEPLATNHKQEEKISAKALKFDPVVLLTALDVPEAVINDWLKVRKAKRAPVTETVIDGFKREAAKAGMSLTDAIRISIERNWQSFKAEWMTADGGRGGKPAIPDWRKTPARDEDYGPI